MDLVYLIEPFREKIGDIQNSVTELELLGHKVIHCLTDLPVSFISIYVGLGSALEPRELAGISHFIEHTVFKGTSSLQVGDIAKLVNEHGGYINAYTSFDHTAYYIVGPSENLSTFTQVLYDMVFRPAFIPSEVEREREVILEEIRSSEDEPLSFLFKRAMLEAFKEHPFGKPILGWEDTLKSISRELLIRYWSLYYTSQNTFTVIVDHREPAELLKTIKPHISETLKDRLTGFNFRDYRQRLERLRKLAYKIFEELDSAEPSVYRGNLNRAYFISIFKGEEILSEKHPVQEIMVNYLSAGKSSPLYLTFKERLKLVESIDLEEFRIGRLSLISLSAITETDKLSDLRAELRKFFRSKDELINQEDYERTMILTLYDLLSGFESVESVGRLVAEFQLLGDYRLLSEELSKLASVSLDKLRTSSILEPQLEVMYINE